MDKMKTLTVNGKTYEICDPSAPRIDNETVGDRLWSSKQTVDKLAIVPEASGDVISVSDTSDLPIQGLTLYGKTTQDGTPTPDAPAELVSVGDRGSVGVTVAGENKELQTLTASTPNGLPGIPVASGGNYTDENGQQWACDEIDFARGVYVQRVKVADMGAFVWYYTLNRFAAWPTDMAPGYYTPGLCSHYLAVQEKYQTMPDKSVNFNDSGFSGRSCIVVRDDSFTDNEAFKAAVAGAIVMYELAAPVETPLSAEELAQYAALHTNKPNTTVYNDSGAGMALTYVADTKTYIDNKFTALQNAILATGGNI